jgi:prophage antirepressor-like protein
MKPISTRRIEENTVKSFTFPVHVGREAVVRVIMREGRPWFVANEVAEILGFKFPHGAVRDHCKSPVLFKGAESATLTSSPRGINIIPEADVYRMIMSSELESARCFEAWVMETVLPALRQDGGYIVGEEKVRTGEMSEDELVLKAMQIMDKKMERLTAERDALMSEVSALQPKAELFDQYMNTEGTLTLTEAGKILGISGKALGMELRHDYGWLFKRKKGVIPTQHAMKRGWMIAVPIEGAVEAGYPNCYGRITKKGLKVLMSSFMVEAA